MIRGDICAKDACSNSYPTSIVIIPRHLQGANARLGQATRDAVVVVWKHVADQDLVREGGREGKHLEIVNIEESANVLLENRPSIYLRSP